MTKKTTRREQYSDLRGTLYLAFELGLKEWKLGFSIGLGQKARRRTIPGGDLEKLVREIAAAKKRFELRVRTWARCVNLRCWAALVPMGVGCWYESSLAGGSLATGGKWDRCRV